MTADKPRMDLRLGALLIGVILSTVDSSALNLALPTLAAHFGTDAGAVQGASSLYLVGAAISFLPVTSLAGRIGAVRVYRFSLAAFAAISPFLAMSPNLHTLLALRFVQGIAGAGIVGLVPGMTAATFKVLTQSYRPDLICYEKIIVELKALRELTGEHRSQVLNYLKSTGLRLGILVNFGNFQKATVERIVL